MQIPNYQSLLRFSDEKMAKVNLYESAKMFADLYCLKPGQEQKVHMHEREDKIYFVLEGRPTAIVGEVESHLEAGESCVAPAGEPHGVRNDTEENAVLLVFMAPHPKPPTV
ncbi:MAG: cupin domain-containing protein [Candidatus Kapaibacterium sp.]|nr:cupin domain-containing protein [Ignavibacteria bacterium]